jgi:hypothetical protein
LPKGGRHIGQDAGEREYRPGLWMIQFTALDSQRATQYARQGSAADGVLEVAARAIADGRSLLLDVTMGSEPSVRSWLVNLGLAVYSVEVRHLAEKGPA